MDEMKFMLVGTPRGDSVWLHRDTASQIGVSVWHDGKLLRLEHPAHWLAPFIYLAPILHFPTIRPRKLLQLREQAVVLCVAAMLKKDRYLLAESLCTALGYQCVNGAPVPPTPPNCVLGRVYTYDAFSDTPYLLAVTTVETGAVLV